MKIVSLFKIKFVGLSSITFVKLLPQPRIFALKMMIFFIFIQVVFYLHIPN